MDTSSVPLKQCSRKDKCINPLGCWLPATTEYFHKDNSKKYGVCSTCKECAIARARQWGTENRDRQKTRNRRYYQENRDRVLSTARKYARDNRETISQKRQEYHYRTRDERLKRKSEWRKQHPAYNTIYYREWRGKNIDRYRLNMRVGQQRRRARKRNLPAQWTKTDVSIMLDYWDHRCCICGRAEGLWNFIAEEHWIAINDPRPDNPGTVPWNMLPMCQSGKGSQGLRSCNQSKHDKDPIKWLFSAFEKTKAENILERIHIYFEWIKSQQ